jgi:EpsI family protein
VTSRIAVALLFVGLNLYVFRYFASEDFVPARETFASFPLEIDGWRCSEPVELGDDILARLNVTDYLLCDFRNEENGRRANVYIGYHASQTRDAAGHENIIHPPEHCLPGSGWDIIQSDVVPAPPPLSGEAKRVVIAKGNHRSLVYFWYQERGRVMARNHEKILYLFMDRALTRRTDGSLVRFTVPILLGDEEGAERNFRALAASVAPLLADYLPN